MAVHPRTLARLEARILQRAAYCVEFELNDPRSSFITLTRVELARDLSTARVHYSVLGSEADKSKARHMLDGASGYVQHQVGRVLRTRRTPRILWAFDDSIERAADMDRRIKEALRKDRAINPAAHADALNDDETDSREADEMAEVEYEEFLDGEDDED